MQPFKIIDRLTDFLSWWYFLHVNVSIEGDRVGGTFARRFFTAGDASFVVREGINPRKRREALEALTPARRKMAMSLLGALGVINNEQFARGGVRQSLIAEVNDPGISREETLGRVNLRLVNEAPPGIKKIEAKTALVFGLIAYYGAEDVPYKFSITEEVGALRVIELEDQDGERLIVGLPNSRVDDKRDLDLLVRGGLEKLALLNPIEIVPPVI